MAISETREQRLAREAAEKAAADAKRKEQEKASYLEIAKKPGMQEYLTKFATAYKKAFETGDFSGLQTVINEQVNNKGGLFEFGRRDHNGPPTYDTAFEGLLNMATKMGEYGITPPLTKTVQADKYASIYKDIYKKASDRTVSSPLGRLQMELNAIKKYKENEEVVKKSAPPNLNNLNELSGKTFSKLTSGGRVDSITFIPNSLGYTDHYKYQLQGTGEWRFGKKIPSNAVPGTGSYLGRDYSVYYKDEKGETRSMPIDNLSTFGITVNALPQDYINYVKGKTGSVASLSKVWNGDIGDVNAAPKKAGPSSYETADGKSIGKFDAGYDQYDKYVKGLEAAGINYKGESISGAPLTPDQQAYLANNKQANYGVFINNAGQQVTATSLEMLKNMTALGFPQVSAPTATMNTTQQAELAAVAPGIPRTDLQLIADKLIAAKPTTVVPVIPIEATQEPVTTPLATAITETVPTNQNPTLAATVAAATGTTTSGMTTITPVTAPQTNTGDSSSLLSVDEIKRITATIAKPYESPSLASTLSEIKAPTIKPVAAPQTSYASSGQSTPVEPGEPLKRAIIRSKRVNSINPLAKRGGSPRLKTKLNYA